MPGDRGTAVERFQQSPLLHAHLVSIACPISFHGYLRSNLTHNALLKIPTYQRNTITRPAKNATHTIGLLILFRTMLAR